MQQRGTLNHSQTGTAFDKKESFIARNLAGNSL